MRDIGDPPDIRWITRTGYPQYSQPEPTLCEECGKDITDDDIYDDAHHEYLCKQCLLFFHLKD